LTIGEMVAYGGNVLPMKPSFLDAGRCSRAAGAFRFPFASSGKRLPRHHHQRGEANEFKKAERQHATDTFNRSRNVVPMSGIW